LDELMAQIDAGQL
jgi:putative transposase